MLQKKIRLFTKRGGEETMKRIISAIMLMVLLFSNCIYAAESKKISESEILQIAETMLQVTLEEPKAYGLDNIDYDQLAICKPIKPYNYESKNIQVIEDIEYYPVISGDNIVGNFTVCYGESGDYSVSFDTQFVKELNKYYSKNEKFALIHNNGELIVKNKNSVTKIISSEGKNTIKQSAKDVMMGNDGIELTNIEKMGNITSAETLAQASASTYKRIDMLYVSQGSYNLCWAAVAASMGEYYTGTTKTATYVADQLGIGYNDGGTVIDTKDALDTIYGKNAVAGAWILDQSSVVQAIDADTPIAASFGSSTGSMGHQVVICGYSYGSQGMVGIVRDSNYSSYKLVYQAVSNGTTTFSMDYYTGGTMYWRYSCIVQ